MGPAPSASLPTGFDSSSVHINVQSSEQDVWGRMRSTDCNSPGEAGFGSDWVEVMRRPPSLSRGLGVSAIYSPMTAVLSDPVQSLDWCVQPTRGFQRPSKTLLFEMLC